MQTDQNLTKNESTISADEFRKIAAEIEKEVGMVIVGQQALVRQTLITLLAGGNALIGRRAWSGKDHVGAHPGSGNPLCILSHPVYARLDAGRYRWD
jgi:hypothetical protein